MKRIFALALVIIFLLTPTLAHANGQGRGRLNLAFDPYGQSTTLCGFVGIPCRRIYATGAWDNGTWSGGFNASTSFGWGQDTNNTALCIDLGSPLPWYAWDLWDNCISMFGANSGTYALWSSAPPYYIGGKYQ